MYVRTDNEIEDLRDYFVEKELSGHPYVHKQNAWCIYRESIRKKSKNIDDLLDERIVDVPSDPKLNRLFNLDKCKDYQLYLSNKNIESTIKGGIWTKWGLRFVAEYKNGKWVLLCGYTAF